MKIAKLFCDKYVYIIILIYNCFFVFPQDTIRISDNQDTLKTKDKYHINIAFANIQIEENYPPLQDNLVSLQIEVNRKIVENFNVGGYFGFGLYEEWLSERDNNSISLTFLNYTNSVHYGLNSNFQILPLLTDSKIPRFDLYLSGKIGIISLFSSSNENIVPKKGHYFDYSLMGGGSLYLLKKFGLYAELGYKNFKYHKGFNARYGLTFRF